MIDSLDLFFRGGSLSRLQLGFDNPNKAAVLLGCLALVFAVGAFRARRTPLVVGCVLASGASWIALVLTYSRGGLVSALAAFVIVLAAFRRRLGKRLTVLLLLLATVWCVAGIAGRGKAPLPRADASIGNRLAVWRAAPRIMADAPTGWGVGNAGSAYCGWYQPLRNHERYRTLVSGHLTALAEFGLTGRILSCAGWLAMLGVCAAYLLRKGDPLPLAIWFFFCLTALFSSVTEAKTLWILPILAAIAPLWWFVRGRFTRRKGAFLLGSVAVGAVTVFALQGWGAACSPSGPTVRMRGNVLMFGGEGPTTWIVRDLAVLGGPAHGRALRLYAQQATNAVCALVSDVAEVPRDARRLVLCGTAADPAALADFSSLEEVRVLSPACPEKWLAVTSSVPVTVFCGEFDPRCPSGDSPRLRVVTGNGAYLTHWPEYALVPLESLKRE